MPPTDFAGLQSRLQQFTPEIRKVLWDDAANTGKIYRLAFDENGDRRPASSYEDLRDGMGHENDGEVRQTEKLFELVLGRRELPTGPAIAQKWRGRVTSLARQAPAGPAEVLAELAAALNEVVVEKTSSKEDTLRREVLEYLREHPEVGRDEIAAHVDVDESKVYWELKELRSESDGSGPLVVARRSGQGGPLVYRLAVDPESDARDNWFGIGGQGRAAAASRLRSGLIEHLKDHPDQTIEQIQGSDEFGDYANSQIYWALRELRDSGAVTTEGRPMRHRVAPEGVATTAAGGAVEEGGERVPTHVESAGLDTEERKDKARRWYQQKLLDFTVLCEEAEVWMRARLDSERLKNRKCTVESRVKDEESFSKKAARACSPDGKLCRRCRQHPADSQDHASEPHFYYTQDTDFSDIEDMVGIRVVVPTDQEKETVLELLGSRFPEGSEQRIGDDRDIPGYRGTHLILNLIKEDLRNPAFERVIAPIEVQVRTLFEDAGARIEHALLYKGESTKTEQLSPVENRLLRTIFGQLEVAEREFNNQMKDHNTGRQA